LDGIAQGINRHDSEHLRSRLHRVDPQHLKLLFFEHDCAIELEIDFAGEHMKASVSIELATHLPRVNQVVNIVALDLVQLVHYIEEANKVNGNTGPFAAFLPQVVRRESMDVIAEGVSDAKECYSGHHHVDHLLHHHEVVHFEAEV